MRGLLEAVVLAPALAALLGLLAVRHVLLARVVALLGSAVTVVAAAAALVTADGWTMRLHATLPALAAGDVAIPLKLMSSGPVLVIALVVAVVGATVQVFSTWYLHDDDRYAEFAASVSLFCSAMLLVVTSADLVLTLVGWEVMGWCSYLLIGHWSRRHSARRAAHKAFMLTRFADVGFVLGIVMLAGGPRSTLYPAVMDHWLGGQGCKDGGACAGPDQHVLTLALVLLLIGILGKSAQFPLHDWLPDAMEGPTPASALIHAATMVAAGTFVIAQLFDLFLASDAARMVLAVSTAITMVGAAVLAFGQSDLKRLLAYSTVSQVGVMLSGLAAATAAEGPGPGVLHLYAHAFFKALLFLVIGWMSVLAGGTSAVALRGVGRRSAVANLAFLFGLLSLAGLPFVVGGVSKEHVIAAAYAGVQAGDPGALVVFVALLVTVPFTAAYATRAYLVVSAGDDAVVTAGEVPPVEGSDEPRLVSDPGGEMPPEHDPDRPTHQPAAHPSHESTPAPPHVVGVILLLLGLTVFGGLVLLSDVLHIEGGVSLPMLGITVALVLVGALVAWRASRAKDPVRKSHTVHVDPATRLLGARMRSFDDGLGVDRLYHLVVVNPVVALAHLVAHVDDTVVDATARGSARAVALLGAAGVRRHSAERPATGLVWVATAAVVLGALGVVAWH